MPSFVRGESNGDGSLDIADAISILTYLFALGEAPSCLETADANDDGAIDVADAIKVLGHLFNNECQNRILHIINEGNADLVVTIPTPSQVDGLEIEDRVINIPQGEERFIGPFFNHEYGNPNDDGEYEVWIDLDQDDSILLLALQLGLL